MEQMTTLPLSVSTNGEAVHIVATGTPGDLVHTAPDQGYDMIWIFAGNNHSAAVLTTLEWTTTGLTGEVVFLVLKAPTTQLQAPLVGGLLLRNGATISVFAATTAVINIYGYVERYS